MLLFLYPRSSVLSVLCLVAWRRSKLGVEEDPDHARHTLHLLEIMMFSITGLKIGPGSKRDWPLSLMLRPGAEACWYQRSRRATVEPSISISDAILDTHHQSVGQGILTCFEVEPLSSGQAQEYSARVLHTLGMSDMCRLLLLLDCSKTTLRGIVDGGRERLFGAFNRFSDVILQTLL